jgi:serine/threonine-protein kinase RsbW
MSTASFPGRFDQLERISLFVEQAAEEAGLDARAVYAVQSAVDEACSNIIEHAYGGEGLGEIQCTCLIDSSGLTVILHDQGKTFDPTHIPEPDLNAELENVKIGGLGLYFIRKLMDEVSFHFDPIHGNTLTMVKRKE